MLADMPLDSSIYSNIQPVKIEGPLDQYSKLAQLKSLQSRTRLEDLQGQTAEQSIADAAAQRQAAIESGGDLSKLPGSYARAGLGTQAIAAEQARIKAVQEQTVTAHTQAQTQEITAKHIAGAWSALAKYNGSDEGVKATHDLMAPVVGEAAAQQVTAKLLAMPPANRLAYSVAQAATNPVGQEALKLYFPETSTQTMGTAPDYQISTTKARPGLALQQPGTQRAPATPQPIDLAKVSPADLEAGYRYFSDGTLPPNMGRGNQGAAQATHLRDIAAEISKSLGVSPDEVRANQLAFKGSGSALMGLMKREAGVGANVRNFDFNSDQALQLSDKVDRTGTPIVNAWINAGRRKVSGNPEISAFDVAIKTTVNEFAQIVSGTTAGATTEGEKKKAEDLLNAQQTPAQIKSVINQMRVESQNRMKSFADQKSEVLRNMRGGRGANALPVSGAAAPALSPEAQKLIDKYAPVGGVRG